MRVRGSSGDAKEHECRDDTDEPKPLRMSTDSSAVATVTTAALRLGIVTPMANEKTTALEVVDRVLAACTGFSFGSVTLFVILDNVSRDGTRSLLEGPTRMSRSPTYA